MILSGRASVDVLRGLASATITLAAGWASSRQELLEPPFAAALLPPPTEIPSFTVGLTASVSVGIHISICWVVDVDSTATGSSARTSKPPRSTYPWFESHGCHSH